MCVCFFFHGFGGLELGRFRVLMPRALGDSIVSSYRDDQGRIVQSVIAIWVAGAASGSGAGLQDS